MPAIWGRNPVREALRAGQRIEKIYLAEGLKPGGVIGDILDEARRQRIPVQSLNRHALDRLAAGANHQGVVAEVGAYEYADLDEILARAASLNEPPFLLLLDTLQDPQNLGTLIRTAEAVGVHGVVIPRHRAVGITPAVVKASAGAIEHVLVAQVTNLAQAIEELKRAGVWVAGLDGAARDSYDAVDLSGPLAIVVGAEGPGLSRLVKERCDLLVKLPMRGKVASLNAAVAGSVVLYHAWRERSRAPAQAR